MSQSAHGAVMQVIQERAEPFSLDEIASQLKASHTRKQVLDELEHYKSQGVVEVVEPDGLWVRTHDWTA